MTEERAPAERALLERAVHGDTEAIGALAARHRPDVVRTAQHVLGDREAAEDVAQDVLIRLQAALPGFRGDAELGTWVYRITLNLCRDRLRTRARRAREVRWDASGAGEQVPDPAPGPNAVGEDLDRERTRAAIRAAIDRLPREQSEAVRLRYLSDLPYAEIARLTGVPQGTVASRVFRALKRLGNDLAPPHLEILK